MLLEISVTVIAVVIVVMSVFLAVVLLRVLRVVREAEAFLGSANSHIAPVSHDLTIILRGLTETVNSAKDRIHDLEKSVANIKEGSARLGELEQHAIQRIEEPLSQVLAATWAISQVVLLVTRALKRRR
jgi:uncharacterized protein YoxC